MKSEKILLTNELKVSEMTREEKAERKAYLDSIPEYTKLKADFYRLLMESTQRDEEEYRNQRFWRRVAFAMGFMLGAGVIALVISVLG